MRAALERAKAAYRRDGPRSRDAMAVAIGLFLTLLAAKTPWSPTPRPVILVAGSVGSLALWWRRRWPVPTTLAGIATFVLSGNPWPLGVGLSTTASQRRDRVLAAVTAVASVGFALPVMIDLGRFDLQSLVNGVAEAGFVAAIGSYLGTRHDLMASLRDRAARAEAERELRDEQARAGERARIAREMHDVLAHKVSLIALHAGALEVNPAADPSRVEEVAGVIRTTARQTLEELRSVLGVLRGDAVGAAGVAGRGGAGAGEAAGGGAAGHGHDAASSVVAGAGAGAGARDGGGGAGWGIGADLGGGIDDLVPQPQAADVRRLVDASRQAGVAAELRDDLPDVPALPDASARAVYRIVQEGLTNVHKHAPGAATVVFVRGDEHSGVTVSVTNGPPDATGSLLPGSGTGLVGLRERVRLLGGTLRSRPEVDGGWRLDAWLPWTGTATDGLTSLTGVAAAAASDVDAGQGEARTP